MSAEVEAARPIGAPVGVGFDEDQLATMEPPRSAPLGATAEAERTSQASRHASTADHASSADADPSSAAATQDGEKGAAARRGSEAAGAADETKWVEFDIDDPEDPFNSSRLRKYTITALVVLFTSEVAATASAYVPGIASMERDLGVQNHLLSLLGISLYPLGFALPPMILAPVSEVFGRYWVFIASYIVYLAFILGAALAPNMTALLIFRFLSGAAASTGSTLSGGVISDIFRTEDRGLPMSLFATGAIFGTGFGPAWAGWVEQNAHLQWRWIQWILLIYNGVSFFALLFCLKETRGSVILTRRAERMRKETGDMRYRARAEVERASLSVLIKNSLTRPFVLLFSEPIVFSFSLWISWLWLMMYSLLSSIGLIAAQHGYSPGQVGSLFWAIVVAGVLGQAMNPLQDHLYRKHFPTRGPEARLYLSMLSAIGFPIGCFIYAWTSLPQLSIAGPIIGVVVIMVSVYHVYLAVFNYLADSYLLYASSALAAQAFSRNVFGFAAPLFTTYMYENLGYQWASSLVGFIGIALGVVPFVLFAYGGRIRAKSRFAKHLAKLEAERREREELERARRKALAP